MVLRGRHKSFASLRESASEGVDYSILLRERASRIAIIAPHGGGREPGTSEVAEFIAGRTHSLYCFKGIKNSGNSVLHITSTQFDEPRCEELIRSAEIVVAIHACDLREAVIYVGGLLNELRAAIIVGLTEVGFDALEDDTHHGGADPRNICNRGRSHRGVQLELSHGLRRTMFESLSRKGRTTTTTSFSKLTTAIRQLLIACPEGPAVE